MTTSPNAPRGPFSGPPRVSKVTLPTGDTILSPERPYEPSWEHQARVRTTWTDRLGGSFGLQGAWTRPENQHDR
jgi:hypothetical protein